ncbi:MAG TPA: hypothetical protein VFK30_09270 [Anaerolineae bacterium]|nr:hypothetical protein [Anaerolineae bacterium]
MTIDLNIRLNSESIDKILLALAAIKADTEKLIKETTAMAATLDDVVAETTRQTTIEASTESFIAGLQAQIQAAGGDAAKIQQIFDTLKANNDRLAAAIVAGTPNA